MIFRPSCFNLWSVVFQFLCGETDRHTDTRTDETKNNTGFVHCTACGWYTVEYGLTSHSTHYRTGSGRIVAAVSAEAAPQCTPQCVRCWVCAARPLITVVCKCVTWKALFPYILDAWRRLWVSLKHTFTCVCNQPSSATLKHRPPGAQVIKFHISIIAPSLCHKWSAHSLHVHKFCNSNQLTDLWKQSTKETDGQT